jgi:Carbohydrate/starch-binding module (family 21)
MFNLRDPRGVMSADLPAARGRRMMDVPVKLLFARRIVLRTERLPNGLTVHWGVEAFIEVENIAHEKRVVVRWRNGDCVDTEATYVRSSGGDTEIWRALSPTHSCWSNEGPGTEAIKFAIRYDVAGKTYWDNNDGWDYLCACWSNDNSVVLGPNLLLKSAAVVEGTGGEYLQGEIFVKNLGYAKRVDVIYTTDRWVHAQTAHASFRDGTNEYVGHPNEVWEFNAPLGRQTDFSVEVRFALRYQVNGKVYWNDNVGLDYVISKFIGFEATNTALPCN